MKRKRKLRLISVVLSLVLMLSPLAMIQTSAAQNTNLKENTYYCIKSYYTGKYLTVNVGSNGANLYLSNYTGKDNQRFLLWYNAVQNAYLITSALSSTILCVAPAAAVTNSNVALRTANASACQYWDLSDYTSGSNTVSIKNKGNTSLALSCNSGDGSSGGTSSSAAGNVYINTYSASSFNYRWYIEKYSEEMPLGRLGSVDFTGCFQEKEGNIVYTFNVTTPGTYALKITRENGSSSANDDDTVMTLYSNGQEITNGSSSTYSYLSKYLDAGNYVAIITNASNQTSSVKSYLTITRSGERYGSLETYTQLTDNLKKIGDATPSPSSWAYYNCLGYALGLGSWEAIEGEMGFGSLSDVDEMMEGYGYERTSTLTNDCIIAYGTTTYIMHFAKYSNGIVKAKLGITELVEHYKTDSYYDTYYVDVTYNGQPAKINIAYKSPVAYYTKKQCKK